MTTPDFVDRVDPDLRPAFGFLPELDFSTNVPQIRAAIEQVAAAVLAGQPEVPGVRVSDRCADGEPPVPVRVYEPDGDAGDRAALLWMHGGGFMFGAARSDEHQSMTWASTLGCVVVSVEYRLAPEHPYPAAVEDCLTAWRWLTESADELHLDPTRIAIGGSSAGACLATATTLLARERSAPMPSWQYLHYPMLDDRDATPSMHDATFPQVWNRTTTSQSWSAYLGDRVGRDAVDVHAAPGRASVDQLRGLPPTYIDVGELDPFRDEDIAFAQRLLQAGVPCELHVTPGAFHSSELTVPGAATSQRIASFRTDAMRRFLG